MATLPVGQVGRLRSSSRGLNPDEQSSDVAALLQNLTWQPASVDFNGLVRLSEIVETLRDALAFQHASKDIFRHGRGLEKLCELIAIFDAARPVLPSHDEYIDTRFRLIKRSLRLLTEALRDHRGNQKYFANHLDGWTSLQKSSEGICDLGLRCQDSRAAAKHVGILYDGLLGLALSIDVCDDFSQAYAVRQTEALPVAFLDSPKLTRLANPQACATLLRLALRQSEQDSSSQEDDGLVSMSLAVFQKVNALTSSNIRNAVALWHTGVLSDLLKVVLDRPTVDTMTQSLINLLVSTGRYGLNSLEDVARLFKRATTSDAARSSLLSLLESSKQPAFIQFDLEAHGFSCVEVPRLPASFPPVNGYTFAAWIRIDEFDPDSHTTLFGAFDPKHNCFLLMYLEKDSHQLILQTSIRASNPSIRFKSTQFRAACWYHVALVQRKNASNPSQSVASLFIDGIFAEQRKCNYPEMPEEIVESLSKDASLRHNHRYFKPVQAFFGTSRTVAQKPVSGAVKSKWSLGNAYLYQVPLSDEYIAVHHRIGPRYRGNMQDCMGPLLTYRASAELNRYNETLHPDRSDKSDIVTATEGRGSDVVSESRLLLSICPAAVLDFDIPINKAKTHEFELDRKSFTRYQQLVQKTEAVAINTAIPPLNDAIAHSYGTGVLAGEPVVVVPRPLDDASWCLAGSLPVLLRLLECANSRSSFLQAVKIFFECVKDNWRISEAMEKGHGFGLLAIIIREKLGFEVGASLLASSRRPSSILSLDDRQSVTRELLELVLEFVGYDQARPETSILVNPMAYRILLIDFDTWRQCGIETQTLYYAQFVAFVSGNVNSAFNHKRLARMRAVKKLIEALKSEEIHADAATLIMGALRVLLDGSASQMSFRDMAMFVAYGLHDSRAMPNNSTRSMAGMVSLRQKVGSWPRSSRHPRPTTPIGPSTSPNDQPSMSRFELAVLALQLLVDLVSDERSPVAIKRFHKAVHNRWLLHLLAESDVRVVELTFNIICRSVLTPELDFRSSFTDKNNGFVTLKSRLKPFWRSQTIWMLCFSVFLGRSIPQSWLSEEFSVFHLIEMLSVNETLTVVHPEILPTVFGMLEAGLREVARDDEQNAVEINTLKTVTRFFAELYDRSSGFRGFAADSRYIQELLFVLFPLLTGTDRLSAETELQSEALSFKGEEVQMRPHSNSLGERPPSVRSLDMQKGKRTPSPMSANRVQAPRRISSFVLVNDGNGHLNVPPVQFATPMAPKSMQPVRINVTNFLVEGLMELASTLFIDMICYNEKFTGIGLFLKVPPAFREHQAYFESYILINALSHLGDHLRSNQRLFTESRVLTNLARYSQHMAEAVSEGWFIDGAQPVLDFTGEILEHLQQPEIASDKYVRLCSQSTNSIRVVFLRATLWRLAELDEDANENHVSDFLKKMTYWQNILFSAENQETLFTKLICYLLYRKLVSQVQAVRLAAARLWRIVLVQKPTETATMLTNTMGPDQRHLSTGFMKLVSMDDDDFLSWVDQNRSTLDSLFDSSLSRSWNDFVENENRTSDETAKNRVSKRRDKLKRWQTEEVAVDDFIHRYEISTNHWRANVHAQERLKLQRATQDHQENVNHLFAAFAKIEKIISEPCGISPTTQTPKWLLDETEAANRMRMRIVPDVTERRETFQPKRKTSAMTNGKLTVTTQIPRLVTDDNPPSAPPTPGTPVTFPTDGAGEKVDGLRPRSGSTSNSQLLEGGFEMVEDPKEDEDGIIEDKNRKVMTSLQRGDMVQQLYNTSRIVGLEACEGLLVIGQKCIYMQDNFFQRSDGEIVSVSQAPEDERDPYVQLISGKDVGATRTRHSIGDHDARHWTWAEVLSVSKRRFLLRDVSVELFFTDGRSYLLTCISTKIRDDLFYAIVTRAPHVHSTYGLSSEDSWRLDTLRNPEDVPKNFGTKFGSLFSSGPASTATKKWQRGEMSNFQYLMLVNTMAGRTFNDLTQYPVFPWVLADYTSEELDLDDPKSFRNFSKPMGCQTPARESEYKDRYKQFAEMGDQNAPPFHYGTHYSSAMIVSSYLIRLQPFVQSYLLLQGGSFDHADRLFDSIEKAWLSASRDNMTDVRELTPEFFYLPEFLTNINGYDFGAKQATGQLVNDVHLPKWAHGNPHIFIAKHRNALESRFVSDHLHEWIDLVFGFEQRGEAAVEATNVFNHLSYEGAKDLDKINDQVERLATIGIIHSFGQTPYQVFHKSHPPREVDRQGLQRLDTLAETLTRAPDSIIQIGEKVIDISFSPTHNKLLAGGACHLNLMPHCKRTLQWGFADNSIRFFSSQTKRLTGLYENTHIGPITAATFVDSKTLVTGGQDCTIGVWKINDTKDMVEIYPKTYLFGHRTSVTVLAASRVFSTLLSASEDGQVVVWGLNRQNCIRILLPSGGPPIRSARISNSTGRILLCRGANALLYTINGHLLVSQNLCDREKDEILSCAFYEGTGNEYLARELVFTGHTGGITNVWTVTALSDGTWHLLLVKRMSHIDGGSGVLRPAGITSVLPVAKGVYTGDEEGNVWSWECVERHSSINAGWGRG